MTNLSQHAISCPDIKAWEGKMLDMIAYIVMWVHDVTLTYPYTWGRNRVTN